MKGQGLKNYFTQPPAQQRPITLGQQTNKHQTGDLLTARRPVGVHSKIQVL